MQLPVAQTLDVMWYQALASVSALRTFRDPPAQWRSFSRRDAIPAWGRLYNRLHPGVDIYSVHFVKKMPWCQYFNGRAVVPTASSLMAPRSRWQLCCRIHSAAV